LEAIINDIRWCLFILCLDYCDW